MNSKAYNKIVLGTVQFGINYGINNKTGQVPFEEVCKIINIAKKNGIMTLDTSSAYGTSENVLGMALKACTTEFKVISKYPKSDQSVRDTFMRSLDNLGVESLYGYLVHDYEYYREHPFFYNDMLALKNEGLIKKIGFSIYTIDELHYLLNQHVLFDIIQFPYNIFDRQFEPYMSKLSEMDVEIHTRSAFLQGLFFKNTNTLSGRLKPLKRYLDDLHDYCNQYGITIEQIAFGYVLSNEYIQGALIGVDNHIQLECNLQAASYKISKKDIDFIKSINIQEKELLNPSNWSS